MGELVLPWERPRVSHDPEGASHDVDGVAKLVHDVSQRGLVCLHRSLGDGLRALQISLPRRLLMRDDETLFVTLNCSQKQDDDSHDDGVREQDTRVLGVQVHANCKTGAEQSHVGGNTDHAGGNSRKLETDNTDDEKREGDRRRNDWNRICVDRAAGSGAARLARSFLVVQVGTRDLVQYEGQRDAGPRHILHRNPRDALPPPKLAAQRKRRGGDEETHSQHVNDRTSPDQAVRRVRQPQ
mmetsp:Transcript_8993/g.28421  ORF Transcript_8993/g.28421 Transcript_8993/m.28421 type:complete len:240 (+) Transcript_8993:1158-1877(+)